VCGDVQWTFGELDDVCTRLAGGLFGLGVGAGDPIAILSRNSHAFAAIRFAIARLGAVLVPINFMLKEEEAAYILRHSGARLLLVDSEFYELGRAAAALDTQVQTLCWLPSEAPCDSPAGIVRFDELASVDSVVYGQPRTDDVAQIIYTSGTESLPKGAILTHEAVIWQYVSCIIDGEMSVNDIMLHSLPLYHCAQLDVFLGPAIYLGATSVITSKPTPDNILSLMARHRVTSFFAPPTVWISLLRSPDLERRDTSKLRKGYYGASIMPEEVLREMQCRLPQVRLWNCYGQTEIAPLATVLRPEEHAGRPTSAGKPVLNVETRVVDDDMQDVGPGEIGEIVHRSPQLLMGYYRDEERTQAAFRGGWFHTGDLGSVDSEGYITVVDRKKDMIKTGGENVASREVEETIYRLPQVSEVAVIGVPHPRWIEAVTAVIVVRRDDRLTEDQVIEHCQRLLAAFKVPKGVVFLDDLPKNPSGKLLKRELRKRLEAYYNDEALKI
jgi:fatty-acyl-CoA synthase